LKASQGKTYTIVKGDTLSGIALQAYGRGNKWRIIWKANKNSLRSGDPNLIYPGEVITIPIDSEEKSQIDLIKKESSLSLLSEKNGKVRLVIDGNERNFVSLRVSVSIDTVADAVSFVIDADSNKEIGIEPYGFEHIEVYIDDTKVFDGYVYIVSTQVSSGGSFLNVNGFSGTVDIVDSTSKPPYQFKNKTLKQISTELCEAFGINVIDKENDIYKFKKVEIDKTEKVFAFIKKLATQRLLLFRSNIDGDIEIVKSDTFSKPIGTISEENLFIPEIECSFDARKRFSDYRSSGTGPGKNISALEKDEKIKRTRIITEKADETTKDKIKDHCSSIKKKHIGESVSIKYISDEFYTNKKELWECNKIISIEDVKLFLKPGTKFLIKSIEYESSVDSVKSTIELTLPEVYNDSEVKDSWTVA
jgi:prophage tail gpP-like protein